MLIFDLTSGLLRTIQCIQNKKSETVQLFSPIASCLCILVNRKVLVAMIFVKNTQGAHSNVVTVAVSSI